MMTSGAESAEIEPVPRTRIEGGHADLRGDVVDGQTRDLALQCSGDVRYGTVGQHVAADLRDGARQMGFHLRAVTHHDHFVEGRSLGFHLHVDDGLLTDRHFDLTVTDVSEDEHRVRVRHGDRIGTVDTCGSTGRGGVLGHHGNAYQRSLIIGNDTFDGVFLREGCRCADQQGR